MTARMSPNQAAAAQGRERRNALCEFVNEYVAIQRLAPTREEIAEALGISTTAVRKHISLLSAEGAIEDLGGTRGLRTL